MRVQGRLQGFLCPVHVGLGFEVLHGGFSRDSEGRWRQGRACAEHRRGGCRWSCQRHQQEGYVLLAGALGCTIYVEDSRAAVCLAPTYYFLTHQQQRSVWFVWSYGGDMKYLQQHAEEVRAGRIRWGSARVTFRFVD